MATSVFFGGGFAAANPCPVPGLVPGVCYAERAQPTTPALVAQAIASMPVAQRAKVQEFGRKRVDGPQALSFYNAWASLAWDAQVQGRAIYDRLARTPMPGFDPLLRGNTIADVSASTPVGPGLKEYFDAWRGQLDDIRRAWDRMHEPKEALRAHLATLPAGQAIDDATRLEVQRHVAYYAGIAGTVVASVAQQSGQMAQLIAARQYGASFAQVLDDLKAAPGALAAALGAGLRTVLTFALKDVLAPLVNALVPRWVWVALVGVGGLVVYGVVSGNPLVGAARRALRRG